MLVTPLLLHVLDHCLTGALDDCSNVHPGRSKQIFCGIGHFLHSHINQQGAQLCNFILRQLTVSACGFQTLNDGLLQFKDSKLGSADNLIGGGVDACQLIPLCDLRRYPRTEDAD